MSHGDAPLVQRRGDAAVSISACFVLFVLLVRGRCSLLGPDTFLTYSTFARFSARQ